MIVPQTAMVLTYAKLESGQMVEDKIKCIVHATFR